MKKLKRIIPLMLVLVMSLSIFLVACNKDKGDENGDGDNPPAVTTWKVTFDYNYDGAPAAYVVDVQNNERVVKPTDPTRDGYTFKGWFTDKATMIEEEFLDKTNVSNSPISKITSDITFYAGWEKIGDITPPDDDPCTEHVDEDEDGFCDKCDEEMPTDDPIDTPDDPCTEHEDEDDDGFCDKCDEEMPTDDPIDPTKTLENQEWAVCCLTETDGAGLG